MSIELDREIIALMTGYSRMYIINSIAEVEEDLKNCRPEEAPAFYRLLANYQEDLNKVNAFDALFADGMREYTFHADKE